MLRYLSGVGIIRSRLVFPHDDLLPRFTALTLRKSPWAAHESYHPHLTSPDDRADRSRASAWRTTNSLPWHASPAPPANFVGLAYAALILGIIGVVFSIVPLLDVLTMLAAIVGVVLGAVALARSQKMSLVSMAAYACWRWCSHRW